MDRGRRSAPERGTGKMGRENDAPRRNKYKAKPTHNSNRARWSVPLLPKSALRFSNAVLYRRGAHIQHAHSAASVALASGSGPLRNHSTRRTLSRRARRSGLHFGVDWDGRLQQSEGRLALKHTYLYETVFDFADYFGPGLWRAFRFCSRL